MEETSTSTSGAGPPFVRKTSKSKLAKQDEVLAEDPDDPGHKMLIPETRVESCDVEDEEAAEVPVNDDAAAPEERPESEEALGRSATTAGAKVLVRGNALCGDDDTKLRPVAAVRRSAAGSDPAPRAGLTATGSHPSPGSSLSRDSSNDTTYSHFTDSTGVNLLNFIISTLHKNPKDRNMLLSLEDDMTAFIKDPNKQVFKFPSMSSYNRMLVHRTAAFFGLDHNVDQSGSSVVVSKTEVTRLHEQPFRKYIQHDEYYEGAEGMHGKRLNLASTLGQRREIRSFEDNFQGGGLLQQGKARSFEDRFENLRIMPQDSSSSAEIMESPISGYSSGSGATGASGGPPLLGPGWSSTDSGEGGSHYLRPLSSNSFRPVGNAAAAAGAAGPGQGGAWRPLSSNSLRPHSGSSQSARLVGLRGSHKAGSFGGVSSGSPSEGSPAGLASPLPRGSPRRGVSSDLGSVPPESNDPRLPFAHPPPSIFPHQPGQQVLFAITNWETLPPGAIVLNPTTGQPHLNQDGTVYIHPGSSPQAGTMPASIPYMAGSVAAGPGGASPGGTHQATHYYPGVVVPMDGGQGSGAGPAAPAPLAPSANVVTYVMQSPGSGQAAHPTIAPYPYTAVAYPAPAPAPVQYHVDTGAFQPPHQAGPAAVVQGQGEAGEQGLPSSHASSQAHSLSSQPVSNHGSE